MVTPELQGNVISMMLLGGFFSSSHCSFVLFENSTTFGSVLFTTALFRLLFKEGRLEQETPTGASEVEEDMAGVGPEQLELVFWRELSCASQGPWPTSHNITQTYLNIILVTILVLLVCLNI